MRLIISFLIFFSAQNITAQETMTLSSKVIDSKTRNELPGSTVQILAQDSTVIATTTASRHWYKDGRDGYSSDFSFTVPKAKGTYILRASYLGYKTAYMEVSLGDIKKREFSRELPPVCLKQDAQMLKEVNVVGSKVKFYYRGDTVVYNADAFVLAEGSMLDALVRQMPGVEIKSDGRIYHNGKFVESLLLNGKDFFSGDQQIMLDNLPTYTVKQVKVYDKYGKTSDFLGQKIGSDKRYVMDVSLKKEYAIGMMANVEGGLGTSDRYLGRLFAMRYTDHSRLSVYGNINNLNDKRKPGQDSNWTPEQMPQGDSKEKQFGFDYSVSDRNKKYEVNGYVQVAHSDSYLRKDVDRVNFLSSGDTYEYERNTSANKNLLLNTRHQFDFFLNNVYLHVEPEFNYSDYDYMSDYLSAAFSSQQSDVSAKLIEKLYSLNPSDNIRKSVINRYKKELLNTGHILSGSLSAFAKIKFKDNSDYIDATVSMKGGEKKEDAFNRYVLAYGKEGTDEKKGYQYYKNHPQKDFDINASLSYNYKMSSTTTLAFAYYIDHLHKRRNSSLFLLDELSAWGDSTLGVLPSVSEYMSVQDKGNSYESDYFETVNAITPSFEWDKTTDKGSWYFYARLQFLPIRQKLDYMRGVTDTTLVKNTFHLSAPNWILNWMSKDRTLLAQMTTSIQSKSSDLTHMVDIVDDTDPLNIKKGNPSLKDQTSYEANILVRLRGKQLMQDFRLKYRYLANAIVMGYTYNEKTGVRTYCADNVNGNWTGAAGYNIEAPVDKKRRLSLKSNTSVEFNNSVDLVGSEMGEANTKPSRSTIKTYLLKEDIRLNYKPTGRVALALKANCAWRNIFGDNDNFSNIHALDVSYGAIANITLPWHMQFSTDVTMYSRRGYEGSSMNTDDLVWNARLSYTMLKGKLVLMLDGFDILNQLNSVTRVVNAQGRTETFTNTLPRYAMLHVAYHFNQKPKR